MIFFNLVCKRRTLNVIIFGKFNAFFYIKETIFYNFEQYMNARLIR